MEKKREVHKERRWMRRKGGEGREGRWREEEEVERGRCGGGKSDSLEVVGVGWG